MRSSQVRSPPNTEAVMARSGKFVIKYGRGGKTHFVLLASNDRVVATSETYESEGVVPQGHRCCEASRRRRCCHRGAREGREGGACCEGRAHEEVGGSLGQARS